MTGLATAIDVTPLGTPEIGTASEETLLSVAAVDTD